MYTEFTVIKLNAIAHRYKDLIYKSLKTILDQPKYKNTGAGVASLHVEVIDGDQNKAPQIIISFDDYLLYIDKRKLQWTKLPEVSKLLEWARTKRDSEKAAERLAWGTAWAKKKYDTWKARPWRKKGLGPVLKEMNQMVLREYKEVIEHEFENASKK